MSFLKGSPLRTPWVGALVLLLCFWTLWSLELNSARLVTDEDLSVSTPQATAVPPVLVPVVDPEADGPNVVNTMPSTSTDPLLLPPSSTSSDILSSPVVPEPATELLPFTDGLTPAEIVASIEPLVSERPLILYAYSDGKTMKERKNARENFEFFLAHGLNAASDFVFIFNGKTDAVKLVPKELNIRIVERANDCYDIGAYAEVLTTDDLYKGYKKFIMLNASIRGPFVPYWAKSCWTDMYLGRITDEVKLIGMTANCWPMFHVQSMIWATDIIGLTALLFPTPEAVAKLSTEPLNSEEDNIENDEDYKPIPAPYPGINSCFHTWNTAVAAEVGSSAIIKAHGYKLDVMMSAYHSSETYEEECNSNENGDVLFDKKYFGTNVHPFETVFMKTNRDIDPIGLARLTQWTKGRKYSSYDYCPVNY